MSYLDLLHVKQHQQAIQLEAQQHQLVRKAQSKPQPDQHEGIVSRLLAAIPGRRTEQSVWLNTRRVG